jgi:hypothetical protein
MGIFSTATYKRQCIKHCQTERYRTLCTTRTAVMFIIINVHEENSYVNDLSLQVNRFIGSLFIAIK